MNTSPPRLPLGRGAAGPRPCPPPGRQHVLGRGAHGPLFLPGPLLPAAAPVHSRLGPRAAGHSRGRLPSWEKCRPLGPAPRARPRAACAPHAQAMGALSAGRTASPRQQRPLPAAEQPPARGRGGTPACAPRRRGPRQCGAALSTALTPLSAGPGAWAAGGGCMRPPPTRPWSGLLWDPSPVILLTRLPGAPGESPRPAGGSEAPLRPWQSPRFASCRPGPPGEGGRAPVPLQRRAWAGEARPLQQRRRHRGPAAGVLAV